MTMITNELLLYRNFEYEDLFHEMIYIINNYEIKDDSIKQKFFSCTNRILEIAEQKGFKGNLWHDFLSCILVNSENAFTTSTEFKGRVAGSLNGPALNDFTIFRKLYDFDFRKIDEHYGIKCFSYLYDFQNNNEDSRYFNKRIRNRISDLSINLSQTVNAEEFMRIVCDFYGEFGVGKLGLHKAFRIEHEQDNEVFIKPITNVEHIYLKDLVGYEIQKKKLIDNTEAFIEGKPSNNVLLFGDSGTGKSSSIKAILNEYYSRGLRMIEVYKHQFKDLSAVINQIKDRNYKFIIYMDDLSFEDFEIEYKYLKAVIEGGLEKRPDNVLIYATSNRRHLVREKYSDKEERDDDLHSRDTVQEKLSLSARFGVSIYYGSPNKNEYNTIVRELADQAKIEISDEELFLEAGKWELSHGGLSGRTARQFINYLAFRQQA